MPTTEDDFSKQALITNGHYSDLGDKASVGTEGLARDERIAVIRVRFDRACALFRVKPGGTEWATLIGCMAALQDTSTRE